MLRQAHKHIREQDLEVIEEVPIVINTTAGCPECHEGKLKLVLNLGFKEIYECSHCDYRKSVNTQND